MTVVHGKGRNKQKTYCDKIVSELNKLPDVKIVTFTSGKSGVTCSECIKARNAW